MSGPREFIGQNGPDSSIDIRHDDRAERILQGMIEAIRNDGGSFEDIMQARAAFNARDPLEHGR